MLYLFMLIGCGAGAVIGFIISVARKSRSAESTGALGMVLIGVLMGGAFGAYLYSSSGAGYRHSDNVIEIDGSEQFDKIVLQSDKPVLVDFYSTGCPPCRKMAPIVAEIAKEKKGDIVVAGVDIGKKKNKELTERYGIKSWPRFFIFKNGKREGEFIGLTSKEDLLEALKKVED